MRRWIRLVALAATLWSAAAPVIAMPIERAAAVQVSTDGSEEEESQSDVPIVPHTSFPSVSMVDRPHTTDDLVLVPDRYLRHCALLR